MSSAVVCLVFQMEVHLDRNIDTRVLWEFQKRGVSLRCQYGSVFSLWISAIGLLIFESIHQPRSTLFLLFNLWTMMMIFFQIQVEKQLTGWYHLQLLWVSKFTSFMVLVLRSSVIWRRVVHRGDTALSLKPLWIQRQMAWATWGTDRTHTVHSQGQTSYNCIMTLNSCC